jgi:hypothetical protein
MPTSSCKARLLKIPGLGKALLMLTAVAAFSSNRVPADELLYIYSPDCGACMKFDQEIAGIYPKTQEAQNLPLVKIDLVDWRAGTHAASQCAVNPVLGTPTFIQIHDCTEVDRITGYSNDELFWFALKRMDNRSRILTASPSS